MKEKLEHTKALARALLAVEDEFYDAFDELKKAVEPMPEPKFWEKADRLRDCAIWARLGKHSLRHMARSFSLHFYEDEGVGGACEFISFVKAHDYKVMNFSHPDPTVRQDAVLLGKKVYNFAKQDMAKASLKRAALEYNELGVPGEKLIDSIFSESVNINPALWHHARRMLIERSARAL